VPSTQPVRDLNYRVIGYRDQGGDKTVTRDCHFNLLGYSDASGTYEAGEIDFSGELGYPQPMLRFRY
jgi:hypothetical protein